MATEPQRTFDFDPTADPDEALASVRAALDDEGMALSPRAGSMDGVRWMWVNGRMLVVVPGSRIVTREADQDMRAAFERQARSAAQKGGTS